MRGRTIILFAVALLLAGGTALLVRSWLAQRPAVAAKPPARPAAPQQSILVARKALGRGQILKPGDLVWRLWPDTALAADFIVSAAKPQKSFTGWVVREPFVAGEPIVKAKIVAPGSRGFLAAVLRPGMRAISVAVNPTSDVAGFVFPGDRVDLLIDLSVPAETGDRSGYAHKAAETVLHDIRVIAIDQQLDSKEGKAIVARTATLEVTPKQSEIVALADDMGKLSLSLRSLAAAPPDGPAAVSLAAAGTGETAAGAAQADAAEEIDGAGRAGAPDGADGAKPRVEGAGSAAAAETDGVAPAIDGAGPSYTLDSEISPLLPRPFASRQNSSDGLVTILRGNGKNGTSVSSQPASRGS